MVQYFIKMATGEFEGKDTAAVTRYFRYACKTWSNDFLYDHCCCWMFCNLWDGASKWSGKDHKGYDAASACIVDLQHVHQRHWRASEGASLLLAPDFPKLVDMKHLTRFLPLWDRLSSH